MSGTKVAMAQPHSFQSGALSFMSCTSGRESLPMDEHDSHQTPEFKTETKKKRFHPLRNLRRMFRRKTRRSSITADSYQPGVPDNPEIPSTNLEQRSCSTSRLQEENLTQNLMKNSRLNPGLSLSHDSIFTPDRADSGLSSSDLENSSLSITVLTSPSKECPMKSQSSCSETSLLSIGSSEVELSPVRSGKLSDLDIGVTAYKLNHSAAKHKMAVKPRRNHGAPRSRRRTLTSKSPLPTTLEVSEEGTTGRSSPPLEISPPESTLPSPSCDKSTADKKTTWSQITLESSFNEAEEPPKVEDDVDSKEEEVANQKAESFFGRFLSRRSGKKKKLQEVEENIEEKPATHYTKKASKPAEGKLGAAKAPNRRQRVEPVEIPAGEKEETTKRRISSSVSPPRNYWPSEATSRSMSPPKVVWPENFSYYVKPAENVSPGWEKTKKETPEVSPVKEPTDYLKDFKNPNFVKELANSVSLFAKDELGKRKKDIEDEREEEEAVPKLRRHHSEEESSRKVLTPHTNITKSDSAESVRSVKSSEDESSNMNANVAHKEPIFSGKAFSAFPVTYDTIPDGYENVQLIESVKQELRNSLENKPPSSEDKVESKKEPEVKKLEKEIETVKIEKEPIVKVEIKELEVKKEIKEPEVVKRVKPVISEKPKDLKRVAPPEFIKSVLTKVETKSFEKVPVENEGKTSPKITLVERRKSELFLLTEAEEKDWKAKIKPLKKQTSFSEGEKRNSEETAKPEEPSAEKTDPLPSEVTEDVVVLRKKSVARDSDDQPELMKVFARRSLKIRESEKIVEDVQKSRDSDKENEMVDERKKNEEEEKKEDNGLKSKTGSEVKVSISPLKPEVAIKRPVFQKYQRSLSENNAKKEEISVKREVLEESKLRNITEISIGKGEKEEEEEEEETGFKRIQQRKAEWERRAQQGTK